jgi:hypothetical protein
MASRPVPNAFFGWTWSAVLAGVFASLVVQILLTMLGFGIGLLVIDLPTAQSAPAGASWAAFVWWAVQESSPRLWAVPSPRRTRPIRPASAGSDTPWQPGWSPPSSWSRRRRCFRLRRPALPATWLGRHMQQAPASPISPAYPAAKPSAQLQGPRRKPRLRRPANTSPMRCSPVSMHCCWAPVRPTRPEWRPPARRSRNRPVLLRKG